VLRYGDRRVQTKMAGKHLLICYKLISIMLILGSFTSHIAKPDSRNKFFEQSLSDLHGRGVLFSRKITIRNYVSLGDYNRVA